MRDLAAATPNLTRSFKVINVAAQHARLQPARRHVEEGYLFWLSWLNHVGTTVFQTQDAHGPIRHGLIVLYCDTAQLLESVAGGEPAARHARRAPQRADRR